MKRSSLLRLSAAAAFTAAAAFAATTACTTLTACIRTESYVYTAQKYDPAADCVTAYAPVELVNGSGAGTTCPLTCFTVGTDLYVSAMCPPLPVVAAAAAPDGGDCIAALAAARRGTCDAPADAGVNAESGTGTDTGTGRDADAGDVPDTSAPPADAGNAG